MIFPHGNRSCGHDADVCNYVRNARARPRSHFLAGRIGQEPQCAIDRCLAHVGSRSRTKAIKVFAPTHAPPVCRKTVEYQIALGRPLQASLLNMFEKDFLLFSHRAFECIDERPNFSTLLSSRITRPERERLLTKMFSRPGSVQLNRLEYKDAFV